VLAELEPLELVDPVEDVDDPELLVEPVSVELKPPEELRDGLLDVLEDEGEEEEELEPLRLPLPERLPLPLAL